jgi:hypothetical protein
LQTFRLSVYKAAPLKGNKTTLGFRDDQDEMEQFCEDEKELVLKPNFIQLLNNFGGKML